MILDSGLRSIDVSVSDKYSLVLPISLCSSIAHIVSSHLVCVRQTFDSMVFGMRKNKVETTAIAVNEEATSSSFSTNEAVDQLEKFRKLHKWDLYLDVDQLNVVDEVIASGDVEKEAALERSVLEDNSPYAEVRASVCCDTCQLHSNPINCS